MTLTEALPMNPARQALEAIVRGLIPPPNYRIVLDVDRQTERLQLTVFKCSPWVLRLFGHVVYRSKPNWSNPECLQRRIHARTYEGLLQQLREGPEFLEFEIEKVGDIHYGEAAPLLA